MALEDFSGAIVPIVHPIPEAVAPDLAILAPARPGPVPLAVGHEAGLPNLVEIVRVDTALRETVPVDVGAGADAAVDEDRRDVDAGAAEIPDVADFLLVSAHVAFAAEGHLHRPAFLALGLDEFHQGNELVI